MRREEREELANVTNLANIQVIFGGIFFFFFFWGGGGGEETFVAALHARRHNGQ